MTTTETRDKELYIALTEHFESDRKSFERIDESFKKTNELLQINGEHMSYIRKDININKAMLESYISDTKEMLDAFKEKKETKKVLGRIGMKWTKEGKMVFFWAGGIITVLALLTVIWTWIKTILLHIKI